MRSIKLILLASTAVAVATAAATARADVIAAATPAADAADTGPEIVVTSQRPRSVTAIEGPEIQKILPGISPLKALQTLPGVTYLTADPWGNNEQNIQLFIYGFNAQQLGYTLDGVPLGDQQYGNYNGLSPQRAIISENIGQLNLATGAGDLGTASTSNLGSTIDVFSSDPLTTRGVQVAQTFGSYYAYRTFVRVDIGTVGNGNSLNVSGVWQDARAWTPDGAPAGSGAADPRVVLKFDGAAGGRPEHQQGVSARTRRALDVTGHEQLFANAQQNIRQFQTSAAAGLSPFAFGSQPVFEDFKASVQPETSWTYEAGIRSRRMLNFGPLTSVGGQLSYYHVDFNEFPVAPRQFFGIVAFGF